MQPHPRLMMRYCDLRAAPLRAMRARIAQALRDHPDTHLRHLVQHAVIETGGTFVTPCLGTWGPRSYAISMLGCWAEGDTLRAAAASWIKISARMDAAA